MNNNLQIKSIGKLLVLHLFPGILLTIVYILFLKSGIFEGYPRLVTMGIASLFSIIPFELGYLIYIAKKEENSYNLFKVLGLKSKLPLIKFILYSLGLFLVTGLLFTLLKPLTDFLLKAFSNRVPDWFIYVEDLQQYSHYYIIITILISFFIFTLIAPIVEELYFRGFLLARMKWMGSLSVLINLALFSVYHFWSPWLIVTRMIAFIPFFYFVYKKDSLKLSITIHCLANLTDVITFMTFLK